MSKFYVGQKVLVTRNSYYGDTDMRGAECVGKVCEVRSVSNSKVGVYTPDECDWWCFNSSDLQPINETQETLTINGVEYIRNPEPAVEHEWKFGDVAAHEKHGVGIVMCIDAGEIDFHYKNGYYSTWLPSSKLTFIRRADLSV